MRRRALFTSAAVAVVMAAFVWVLATRDPAVSKEAESPLLGRPAPALAGATLDGGRYDIDDTRGRWVVVNFFATWCVPCQREHPELVKFSERHQVERDAEVVSVVFDRNEENRVREFFQEEGGDWAVVEDPEGRVALDYGVAGIPESFLVDPNGFVVSKVVGGVRADDLDGLLAQAREAR